jgi:tRNA nucleotidyltransferase (CCA-adding enzyme)
VTALQSFLVGGAVRDALLGLGLRDRDWVVVGATPDQLLQQGYLQVGRDFPVFLHPQSKEEYALARTERKTAPGYHGFKVHAHPDVTLEQDLGRRDLTINAMAVPAAALRADGFDTQDVIDPFDGRSDITHRVLRHVGPAFSEDPVRILRLARFAARFADFTVAPDTMALMRQMVEDGEVDHLVSERVWQEIAKGLMEPRPSAMFAVLRSCGALQRLLPELDCLWGVPQSAQHHPEIDTGVHVMMVLDTAAQLQAPLSVRFACLVHDLGKGTTPADVLPRHIGHEERSVKLLRDVSQRLRVPLECSELAEVVAREHGNIHRSGDLNATATVRLLERCDAFRKPERFLQVLQGCECDARGRLHHENDSYAPAQRLAQSLQWALDVDTAAVASSAAATGAQGPAIGDAIRAARIQAIAQGLSASAAP